MKKEKITFILILLFNSILTIKGQYFQGQNIQTQQKQEIQDDNVIILHKKYTPLYKEPSLFENKNLKEYDMKNSDVIRVRSNVKIITINKLLVKGKVIRIKDSSLLIAGKVFEIKETNYKGEDGFDEKKRHYILINKAISTEISLEEIKYIYHHKSSPRKISNGIGAEFDAILIAGIVLEAVDISNQPGDPGYVKSAYIEGIVFPAIGYVIAASLVTFFCFFHKKEYDVKNKYELIVKENKPKLQFRKNYFYFKDVPNGSTGVFF